LVKALERVPRLALSLVPWPQGMFAVRRLVPPQALRPAL
jgi:hypothetical protein